MKTILTFLLISCSLFLSAQSNSSLDFIGGIDYTYRYIGEANSPVAESIKEYRSSEKGNLNWRFGINYNQRINSRFVLKTGVRLMSLGHQEEITFDNLRWGLQHDGNGGYNGNLNPGEDFHSYKTSDNYWFLELPVVLRYEFSKKKFAPYAEVGIAPAYFLLHRQVNNSSGDKKVTTSTLRDSNTTINKIQLEGILAFGFNYNLKESIQLFGQPTFRYHLTKMWDTDLKEHLWSAGLELGVRKLLD